MPRTLLPLLLLLATPGCCSLAQLFCGPDRSPWVERSWDTPEQALATFLEAIRRANSAVIYYSLSEGYKDELGVDFSVMELAWPKIQEENPWIHVAGTAAIPEEPSRAQDRGVTYQLEVYGTHFEVNLVQQAYWTVVVDFGDGDRDEEGRYVLSLNEFARLQVKETEDGALTRIELEAMELPFEADLSQIVEAGIGRDWRVSGVSLLEEQQ